MHTEIEAKKLWCPMVRIGHRSGVTMNDPEGPDDLQGHCIGSACAMWRWGSKPDPNWQRPLQAPASFEPAPYIVSDKGFCGLAGAPLL